MSRHSDDRLAARALAANRIAAAEQRATTGPVFGPDAHARFLAVGGAHVIVALDDAEYYRVVCEGCGQLPAVGSANPEFVTGDAQHHAEVCRRIPERLWPQTGGAR